MLAPVTLSIFCFRYRPRDFTGDLDALNERVMLALQRAGSSYVSNARIGGNFALRGCVLKALASDPWLFGLMLAIHVGECSSSGAIVAKQQGVRGDEHRPVDGASSLHRIACRRRIAPIARRSVLRAPRL